MTKGERLASEAALCALYLRGAPHLSRVSRRRWPLVADALRSLAPDLSSVCDALASRGLYDESSAVALPGALSWALDVCCSGRALTFLSPCYPLGWAAALGAGAPPCAWVRGEVPVAPAVAVVGSRLLGPGDRAFCRGAARLLMRQGRTLVSGGAVGTDAVAVESALACGGAGRCVVVLPYGIDRESASPGVCLLSVCEPWAEFTTGQAMERNALIYSFGRRALVLRPRLRQGGAWHGAVDALRRRLGDVIVRAGADEASAVLARLGALPCPSLAGLALLLARPLAPAQPDLFGASCVRSGLALYGALRLAR